MIADTVRAARAVGAVARSVLAVERPDRLVRAAVATAPWGPTVAGLLAGAAARYPDRVAVVDEHGSLTYAEAWRRARAVASTLDADRSGPGSTIGILMKNHHGFLVACAAASAVGADVVLLNTGFAAPQLADVVDRERIDCIVHDDEFSDAVAASTVSVAIDEAELRARSRSGSIRPSGHEGRTVILTSGTTGRPKGAARTSSAAGVNGVAAIVERIPLRAGDVQLVAAPLFHAWGFSHLLLGLSRCASTVLRRSFDPDETAALLAAERVRVLVVVPVMLRRLLDRADGPPALDLEVIASSGSAIGGGVVVDTFDRFGPVLYNLYGSTEVAVATVATPDDLRLHPTTAGRVATGVRVEILDDTGVGVSDGLTGRIFVGSSSGFDGYTDGADKERIGGLMSSGDVGRFVDGLLFVDGRDDDMIVSGGENVFPGEVEELLVGHPDIVDAAVIGVDDDEFGRRLAAFVVTNDGGALDADSVRDHVRASLARHKVPRDVVFVDELPRTTTGKLVRRGLDAG